MLTLTREAADAKSAILHITGDATIESVTELHQSLLDGLNEFERLQVDFESAETIDFFVIQILCSAHRTAVARDKRLTFSGKPPSSLAETIRLTGFARHRGCSLCPPEERCLWL